MKKKVFTEEEVLEKLQAAYDEIIVFSLYGILSKAQACQRRVAVVQVANFFKLGSRFVDYK